MWWGQSVSSPPPPWVSLGCHSLNTCGIWSWANLQVPERIGLSEEKNQRQRIWVSLWCPNADFALKYKSFISKSRLKWYLKKELQLVLNRTLETKKSYPRILFGPVPTAPSEGESATLSFPSSSGRLVSMLGYRWSDRWTNWHMASSPKQIFPGCGHITVEPAARPQTHSQFLVPSPVSLTSGHGPFLDILVAKPWPEIGVPSPPHTLPLPSPLDPTKALSISRRPLSTRPLFQCLLTPEYRPSACVSVVFWGSPAPRPAPRGCRGERQRGYCPYLCAYLLHCTHLAPKVFNSDKKIHMAQHY